MACADELSRIAGVGFGRVLLAVGELDARNATSETFVLISQPALGFRAAPHGWLGPALETPRNRLRRWAAVLGSRQPASASHNQG